MNLGAAIASIVYSVFHPSKKNLLVWLSLVGLMTFFMIWEAHPRYIFHFSTLVFILAGDFFCVLEEKLIPFLKEYLTER